MISAIRGKKGEGDLKEEMPGIIIAVIGILLVGLVAYKIYDATRSQEEKSARALADSIEAKINAVSDGESGAITIQGIKAVAGEKSFNAVWRIAGWGAEDVNIPDKCFPESCICICKFSLGTYDTTEEQSFLRSTCQENGYCRKFGEREVSIMSYELEEVVGYATTHNSIHLPPKLIELGVEKTKDAINIVHKDEGFDAQWKEQGGSLGTRGSLDL